MSFSRQICSPTQTFAISRFYLTQKQDVNRRLLKKYRRRLTFAHFWIPALAIHFSSNCRVEKLLSKLWPNAPCGFARTPPNKVSLCLSRRKDATPWALLRPKGARCKTRGGKPSHERRHPPDATRRVPDGRKYRIMMPKAARMPGRRYYLLPPRHPRQAACPAASWACRR